MRYLLPAVAVLFVLGACQGEKPEQKPAVAVAIAPHAWLVGQIAGDRFDVITVVGPGDNHHTYSPTDQQISRLMRAKVFFRSGMSFERGRWFTSLAASGRPRIVDTRTGVALIDSAPCHDHDHDHDHGHGQDGDDTESQGKDPHIWLSPANLKIQAGIITANLAEIDPAQAELYRTNLQKVLRLLDDLDSELKAHLAPMRGKRFYIYHPAWGYFAAAYGMEQRAIEHEGKDPTDAQLTQLLQQARADAPKAIFVQPQVSSRAVETFASQVGARVVAVDPLSADPPAAMRGFAAALLGR